jgi:Uma2 family endonuclease
MLLALKQLEIPPGHKVILKDINWQKFEQILEELGEHRSARIAYEHEALEIRVPLSEHEVDKVFITNFVEIILEELEIDFYPLSSTTFKNKLMAQGIEPDNCFSLGARSRL